MFFIVCGEDTFRSRRKLTALREHFLNTRDASGMNVVRLNRKDHGLDEVAGALFATPFLAEKKLVELEGFLKAPKADRERIKEMIGRKPETTIIVFYEPEGADAFKDDELFGLLRRQKYSEEFQPLSGMKVDRFIREQVGSHGCRIDGKALRELVALVGTDSWLLYHESAKLCAYAAAGGGNAVTVEMVHELVNGEQDESVFAFLDACTGGQPGQAARILEGLFRSGVSELQVTAMLQRQVRLLIGVRDLMNRGVRNKHEIAKRLGVHHFPAGKAMVAARTLSLEALRDRQEDLLEMERRLKTESGRSRAILNAFAARFAASRIVA
ncbi:hypothetical protein AMJ57_04605 [Parcubacteria bacterium SG8_24]|nr:MAG: hypothetical protein AMJ57_04605 [Parcubacteria bacterium SG8_24]